MADFVLTHKAVEDLNGIWHYTIDNWSEAQADRYYEVLLNSFQELADNPSLGKSYDGITSQLRGLKIMRHIIFFRQIDTTTIEITRVLHGRMDLKNRMRE